MKNLTQVKLATNSAQHMVESKEALDDLRTMLGLSPAKYLVTEKTQATVLSILRRIKNALEDGCEEAVADAQELTNKLVDILLTAKL